MGKRTAEEENGVSADGTDREEETTRRNEGAMGEIFRRQGAEKLCGLGVKERVMIGYVLAFIAGAIVGVFLTALIVAGRDE